MKRRHCVMAGVAWFVAVGLGYAIRLAQASGVPAANAMSYEGLLEDATGPLSGTHNIQVLLYDAASSGNVLCQTTATPISLLNGRFAVQLPDQCTLAVGSNPNAWADVLVDGSDTGRTKIGAVPYAIEANHTPSADTAATAVTANGAGGALATTLSTLQGEVHPASAFRATLTMPTSIPSFQNTPVIFDRVMFDLASEYKVATGAFTPKSPGTYLITCGFFWSTSTAATWAATISKGATYLDNTTVTSNGQLGTIRPLVVTTVQLAAGDSVTCSAYQTEGPSYAFNLDAQNGTFNTFTATRLY